MFKTRQSVKLWPRLYLKFGGGHRVRLSKGSGEAHADRFTGVFPNLIVAAVLIGLLLAVVNFVVKRQFAAF